MKYLNPVQLGRISIVTSDYYIVSVLFNAMLKVPYFARIMSNL